MFFLKFNFTSSLLFFCDVVSVADPHHFDPHPDPAFQFDPDPDPTFHSDADPEPASQNVPDPQHWLL